MQISDSRSILTHESTGRGVARHVVVTRNKFSPIFHDHYIGGGGPHVAAMEKKLSALIPKECAARKRFIRGESCHVTIVSPTETTDPPMELAQSKEACLKFLYQGLNGTKFQVIGIVKVYKGAEVETKQTTLTSR